MVLGATSVKAGGAPISGTPFPTAQKRIHLLVQDIAKQVVPQISEVVKLAQQYGYPTFDPFDLSAKDIVYQIFADLPQTEPTTKGIQGIVIYKIFVYLTLLNGYSPAKIKEFFDNLSLLLKEKGYPEGMKWFADFQNNSLDTLRKNLIVNNFKNDEEEFAAYEAELKQEICMKIRKVASKQCQRYISANKDLDKVFVLTSHENLNFLRDTNEYKDKQKCIKLNMTTQSPDAKKVRFNLYSSIELLKKDLKKEVTQQELSSDPARQVKDAIAEDEEKEHGAVNIFLDWRTNKASPVSEIELKNWLGSGGVHYCSDFKSFKAFCLKLRGQGLELQFDVNSFQSYFVSDKASAQQKSKSAETLASDLDRLGLQENEKTKSPAGPQDPDLNPDEEEEEEVYDVVAESNARVAEKLHYRSKIIMDGIKEFFREHPVKVYSFNLEYHVQAMTFPKNLTDLFEDLRDEGFKIFSRHAGTLVLTETAPTDEEFYSGMRFYFEDKIATGFALNENEQRLYDKFVKRQIVPKKFGVAIKAPDTLGTPADK